MLVGKGFKNVYNLSGGIHAWNGLEAEGPVELNMDLIKGDETPAQIIKLAYSMEESLGTFYRIAKTKTEDKEIIGILDNLASIEEKHKDYLIDLLQEAEPAAREELTAQRPESQILEGGFRMDDFLKQNERFLTQVSSLLDMAMMLETQALDLYLRFADKAEDNRTKDVLFKIGQQEKQHVAALGRYREKYS
ncbi:ferritin-like domain-containing protein [Desulfomonile tiedjei]|nr:ferritin family protein [Desulfomonile tiedjei]